MKFDLLSCLFFTAISLPTREAGVIRSAAAALLLLFAACLQCCVLTSHVWGCHSQAVDLALEDAMAALDKALEGGCLELDTYLRQVRVWAVQPYTPARRVACVSLHGPA